MRRAMRAPTNFKPCRKCGSVNIQFRKNRDGTIRDRYCGACKRTNNRNYYQRLKANDPVRYRARLDKEKVWRLNNPDYYKQYHRAA